MLVLTRKHQEKIRIGDNITITILKTKGKAVRVGIEAPSDVSVVRGELVAGNASFESSADSAIASSESATLTRRNRPIAAQPAESWTTKSRPQGDSPSRRSARPAVTHQRVPRANVAQVLPGLIGGAGPLRSMMEQRATV